MEPLRYANDPTYPGLVTYYAPFGHINEQARLVVVGITPGQQQMRLALKVARDLLRSG